MQISIRPNNGVGSFKLGQSLYQALKTSHFLGHDVEFQYNSLNLILVINNTLNMTLFFDSFLQRLLFIEILLTPNNVEYVYQNIHVKEPFTFKNVYNRYFGPTFEGVYETSSQKYYLSYCGICFVFNNIDATTNTNEKLNTCEFDNSCSKIIVYQNNEKENWLHFANKVCTSLNSQPSKLYLENMEKIVDVHDEKLIVEYVKMSLNNKHPLLFKTQKNGISDTIAVQVGQTNMQTMIRHFGFPDNTITKRKNRTNSIQLKSLTSTVDPSVRVSTSRNYMPVPIVDNQANFANLINPVNQECYLKNCAQETIKIHNYFDHGFDVVYDLDCSLDGSNIVSRIIIHQNAIESTEFLKYNKLPVIYDNDIVLATLKHVMEHVQLTGLPVFLDRKEYHVQESDDDFNEEFEIVDPVKPCDSKKKETLKYWGLSIYDGCEVAIWESLINNDEICSVTVLEQKLDTIQQLVPILEIK